MTSRLRVTASGVKHRTDGFVVGSNAVLYVGAGKVYIER